MNIFDIKQNNFKKIYLYIRKKRLATRQEISHDLQLSLPTVTKSLEYLVEHGLISSDRKVANKSGGRKPVAYSYIADAKVAVGLDITKHHIKSIVIDLDGNVVKYIYQRKAYRRDEEYLKLLGQAVEDIIQSARLDRKKILGVGIAMPGLINQEKGYVVDGRVIDNTGMSREDFSKYIPFSTKLIHDSNASGFSEIWMSSEIHNAFYISLCNSVGGSVLLNDSVYMGDGLFSGEIGHLNLIPDGEPCYCGQKGCFDAYCNAERLANYADCDLALFFTRLKQGDEKLRKVWDEYLDYLAVAVNDIRMLFGCTVILGGYVGAYMKDYMEILYRKVDARSPFGEDTSSYLIPCKNKIESVATGAALYFVKDFFETLS